MSTVERLVAEELRAYGDLPVTDHDVEQALAAVHDRIRAGSRRRSRSWLLVAAAVLVVIAVAAIAGRATRSQTTPPANDPVTPGSTLVIEYWSHPLWGHNGMVWVYADGRVITSVREDSPPHPVSYVERRLTSGGLGVLLDRVATLYEGVTTDEFRHPCARYQPCRRSLASVIEVNGVHHNVVDNRRVGDLLFDMESQLADTAWLQQRATPYVPAAYVACYGSESPPGKATEQAALLDRLPAVVRDLLAAKPAKPVTEPHSPDLTNQYCSGLTPSEAARVTRALGLPLVFNGKIHEFKSADGQDAFVDVSVILPHGASGLYGG